MEDSTRLAFLKLSHEQLVRSEKFATIPSSHDDKTNGDFLPTRVEQPFIPGRFDKFQRPMFKQISLFELQTVDLPQSCKDIKLQHFEEKICNKAIDANKFHQKFKNFSELSARLICQNLANLVTYNRVNKALYKDLKSSDVDFDRFCEVFESNQRAISQCFLELSQAISVRPSSNSEFISNLQEKLAHNKWHTISKTTISTPRAASNSMVNRRKDILAFNLPKRVGKNSGFNSFKKKHNRKFNNSNNSFRYNRNTRKNPKFKGKTSFFQKNNQKQNFSKGKKFIKNNKYPQRQ